jgi:hypothetical protein
MSTLHQVVMSNVNGIVFNGKFFDGRWCVWGSPANLEDSRGEGEAFVIYVGPFRKVMPIGLPTFSLVVGV